VTWVAAIGLVRQKTWRLLSFDNPLTAKLSAAKKQCAFTTKTFDG
jgi:hypothetical protein